MSGLGQGHARTGIAATAVQRFGDFRQALPAIARYQEWLHTEAAACRGRGSPAADQYYPEEAFCLSPPAARRDALALVGGMGPLAGALAFQNACEKFENSREIVLYQACSAPNRTTVILADNGSLETAADMDMAARLTGAASKAAGLVSCGTGRVSCIVVCNAAHYFWKWIDWAPGIEPVSLVDSSARTLRSMGCRRVLLLTTWGARAGRVYSTRLAEAGVPFEEPSPALEQTLMRAIYGGVKALDDGIALSAGTEFFQGVLRTMGDFDCILAGCTELPYLTELLKQKSSPDVAGFLSGVAILDPVAAAIDSLSETEGEGSGSGIDR
jgi:aspartate racemase